MFKKINFIFLLIIFLATILRLWRLGSIPPSPDWDEASLGYNAYSILETGRDEYGKFLPVVLRSFDDYKPALYSYLIIPFIKVFGLNIISVRAPSVLFGIMAVITTYYLVGELLAEKDEFQILNFKFQISTLTAFLLAISPWHIQFSRIAFESNVGLTLNLFVLLFFVKGLKKSPFLILSVIFAALAIYVYQAEKVFTPLLLLALLIIYRKNLLKVEKKYIFTSIFIFILFLSPMLHEIFSDKNALLRAKGVSVFSDQTEFLKRNAQKLLVDKKNEDFLGLILDNRRIEYLKAIANGYLSHFDLNWLFVTGDIPRHHAPYMGLLYIFEFFPLFIGIYGLAFGKFEKKSKLAIFSYFFLVPIPASVTTGIPHAVRTLNFLPIFQIFSAIGLLIILSVISKINFKFFRIKFKYYLIIFACLFVLLNLAYYLNQYFRQLNYFYSKDWQYGYGEGIKFIESNFNKYDKILVSNQAPLDQSYIFFLFYLKYPPAIYQQEAKYSSGGFRENHSFARFEFRPIDWEKDKNMKNVLLFGRPSDFPSDLKSLFTVNYLNGEKAIIIVHP